MAWMGSKAQRRHQMPSVTEAMIVEAVRAEARARPAPGVLLVGAQSCEVVRAINTGVGAEHVAVLHLDSAHGGVGCDLGNAEHFLGDDLAAAAPWAIVAVDCTAAKNYGLLREIVRQTRGWVGADGLVLVAGPKKGGAEVAARALRDSFEHVDLLAYRRGERIYRARGPLAPIDGAPGVAPAGPATADPDDPADELLAVTVRGHDLRLIQDRRIFAGGRLDPATKLLAETFEVPKVGAAVLDLGCGNGVLGILAARLNPTGHSYLVDSDPIAVAVARRNATLNDVANVSVHRSDLVDALPGLTVDVALMNPPFHRGRTQDTSLAERFIGAASKALRAGGRVYVVCNRFLRYEPALERLVGPVQEVAGDSRYKVLLAQRRPAYTPTTTKS
jgi:16S rRNA (guanine1207-N2)-methyltransferase